MAGLIGPTCKSPGEATNAAMAIANGKGAPKGMKPKVSVTGVNPVGELFAASVVIEYIPDPDTAQPETAAQTDDGKGDDGGEGNSSKTSEVRDVYAQNTPQQNRPTDTPIIQSMEQLPAPDQNLLVAEVKDEGPQSAEAVAMAEEMKNEFNDRPTDLLVVSNSGVTPEQQASNEAQNQRELDAEETRRERAQADAANAQKEALAPDPLT